jgi:transposase-like protein
MAEHTPRGRRLIPPEERETILRMAEEGKPYREIARTVGRPQGTIRQSAADWQIGGSPPF